MGGTPRQRHMSLLGTHPPPPDYASSSSRSRRRLQHVCSSYESALKRASFLPVQKPGFYSRLGANRDTSTTTTGRLIQVVLKTIFRVDSEELSRQLTVPTSEILVMTPSDTGQPFQLTSHARLFLRSSSESTLNIVFRTTCMRRPVKRVVCVFERDLI